MAKFRISGVPVVDTDGRLIGIITNRDMKFEEDKSRYIREVMTSEGLVTGREGTTLQEAKEILRRHKIEKLPIVDDEFHLKGLITIKDIEKVVKYPTPPRTATGGCSAPPPSASPTTSLTARARWSPPAWTRWCSTPPTATAPTSCAACAW